MLINTLFSSQPKGFATTSRVTSGSNAALYANSPDSRWENDADVGAGGCNTATVPDIAHQLIHGDIGKQFKVRDKFLLPHLLRSCFNVCFILLCFFLLLLRNTLNRWFWVEGANISSPPSRRTHPVSGDCAPMAKTSSTSGNNRKRERMRRTSLPW